MPKPLSITLSLTEEEVGLISYALVTDIIEAKRTIEQCKRHPEDVRSAKYEAEAEAKIPALEALHSKLYQLVFDANMEVRRHEPQTQQNRPGVPAPGQGL